MRVFFMLHTVTSVVLILTCYLLGARAQFITYAATGDSYASGDGAGSSRLLPRFDALCGRFSHAYPVQVANSTEIDVEHFRNLACGGAYIKSVLNTQIPFIRKSDAVTVQVGGNEIDFFLVLNECIYQWHTFSSCDAELTRARELVQSQTFLSNYNHLVSQVSQIAKQGSTVMFLGYARFFNDKSTQCDHVSFSHTDPTNKLSRDIRRKLNDVVGLLNEVIKASADAHGARYVDVDQIFEDHRFCEEGAIEPDEGKGWFFSDARVEQSSVARENQQQILTQYLPNPFKDFLGLTRVFHPTTEGHEAIAAEVVSIIRTERSLTRAG